MERRFYTLDAMRGVAAIAVVILHIGAILQLQMFPYAYLAVDFFFLLSGFVLGRAYEPRLKTSLTLRRFMEMRFIRLYPLFALGLLFGALTMAGQIAFHTPHAVGPLRAIFAFVMNMAVLPVAGYSTLFPLNVPGWSLFFEFVINGVFALILYRLSSPLLTLAGVLLAAVYILAMVHFDPPDSGVQWPLALLDLFRVGFSFVLGMLFARRHAGHNSARSHRSVLAIAALALALAISLPLRFEWLYRATAIGLLMPAIFWFGATAELPKYLERTGAVLGDISYPLYAVHFPLLQIFSFIFTRRLHLPAAAAAILFLPAILWVSWFLSHRFDVPIRKWMSRKLHLRATALPADAAPRRS
jgi:peptidoglycan/LPS O-acetylase OafA/YrhL